MYPLNLTKAASGYVAAGFAVANDEKEHKALTEQGYEPGFVAPTVEDEPTKADVMAALDAAGIDYDKRSGIDKLKALLPK